MISISFLIFQRNVCTNTAANNINKALNFKYVLKIFFLICVTESSSALVNHPDMWSNYAILDQYNLTYTRMLDII